MSSFLFWPKVCCIVCKKYAQLPPPPSRLLVSHFSEESRHTCTVYISSLAHSCNAAYRLQCRVDICFADYGHISWDFFRLSASQRENQRLSIYVHSEQTNLNNPFAYPREKTELPNLCNTIEFVEISMTSPKPHRYSVIIQRCAWITIRFVAVCP